MKDITINQNKLVETAIQDGAYDNNKNFQFLSYRGIRPAIKIRKNSRCRKNTIITLEIRLYNQRKNQSTTMEGYHDLWQEMDCRNCFFLY